MSVYSDLRDGAYQHLVSSAYGANVEIPDVGIVLETEELKDYAG